MSSANKKEFRVKVKNSLGLHARPATFIAKLLQNVKSSVTFTYKEESVNARSIMNVLILAARKNAIIKVCVEGEDAEETTLKLMEAFENQFGESVE